MANSIERSRFIGLARQAARDTADGTANYWMRKLSFTPGRQSEHVMDESAIGVTAETSGVDVTRRWAEPSMEVYVDINAWGLVEYANSETYAVETTSGETAVYDHTFKVGTSSNPSNLLTINSEDPTLGDLDFADTIINGITMNMNTNARLNATIDAVSQYPASGSSTSAIATPQYFYGRQVTVEMAATVSAFSSSTFGATGVTFTRSNNVDTGEGSAFQLGNIDIADHVMQSKSAELTIGKVLTNSTYLDYDKAATTRAVRLTVSDTATTLGTAANPTIQITFPLVSVKSEQSGDNNARRMENLTITPHYGENDDESASYLYKVVVTNTVADYSAV